MSVVAEILTGAGALLTPIAVIVGYYKTKSKVAEVHVLVNSQRDALLNEVNDLKREVRALKREAK